MYDIDRLRRSVATKPAGGPLMLLWRRGGGEEVPFRVSSSSSSFAAGPTELTAALLWTHLGERCCSLWRRRNSSAATTQHISTRTPQAMATAITPKRGRPGPGAGAAELSELTMLGAPTKDASAAAGSPPNVSGCSATKVRSHAEPAATMAAERAAPDALPLVRLRTIIEIDTLLGSAGAGGGDELDDGPCCKPRRRYAASSAQTGTESLYT